MTARLSRAFVVGLAMTFIALSATVSRGTHQSAFLFSTNLKAEFGWHGYLLRGGDAFGPRYDAQFYGCSWATNQVGITSFRGFEGVVEVDVPDLPQGIDEFLPSEVHIAPGDGYYETIPIQASPEASLGDYVMTLRARSGGVTKTAEVSFTVVDELPPLPCES